VRFSLIILLTSLSIFLQGSIARAESSFHKSEVNDAINQDSTPTPTSTPDAELDALNRETRIAEAKKAKAEADKAAAEARKAQAEADKAAVEARLAADNARLGIGAGTTTASAPSGNITGDKNKFIETQLLAEFGARKASQLILTKVCESTNRALKAHPVKVLVISSSLEKSSVVTYSAIVAQLGFLHSRYLELIGQGEDAQKLPVKSPEVVLEVAAPLLIPAATEAVKAAADLINMFRTETEFKDQAVTVDVRTVITLLSNSLLTNHTGVCEVDAIYYPSVYALGIDANVSQGPLVTVYRTLLDDISKGDQTVGANNVMIVELNKSVQDLDKQIDELKKAIKAHETDATKPPTKTKGKKPPPKPFDVEAAKKSLNKAIADKDVIAFKIETLKKTAANLESFKTSLADLLKLLTAVDVATGTPALASLLRAERLTELLKTDSAYSLEMQVTASGTNRIRKNAFFNAKIAHSGGVSISLNLFNNKDQLVLGLLQVT
jgi:uncharacterized coiled-coil protein SlyX